MSPEEPSSGSHNASKKSSDDKPEAAAASGSTIVVNEEPSQQEQQWPDGTTISKPFPGYEGLFQGKVDSFDPETGYYHILYEDGDEEDLSDGEMKKYAVTDGSGVAISDDSSSGNNNVVVETSSRGRRRKVVSYADHSDDDMDEDSSDEEKPKRKKARKSTKRKARDDDDSSFSDATEEESDDDESDDTMEVGTTTEKKSMAESFKPMNNPLFWKESLKKIQQEKEYLDPCGMEATDDIIDREVGGQVLKIGTLLQSALTNGNSTDGTLGSQQRPLKLGTACSGTDAPALALTIVQEQMERLGFNPKLHCKHQFSCEKEPFKQSYLARNFDSIQYPDIVKLTDEEPRDVFGRIQPIPEHNQFTAGTSCKNFSLLHSTKRLDIEDKGCSGETFLAAVEHLHKQQPDFCIFENVIGAPWEKMQEYITGRVALDTVYDSGKQIQTSTKKEKQTKELKFELQQDGHLMATDIPPQVGVRCGAIIKGFYCGDTLVDANWSGKKKTCTLEELLKANPKVNRKRDVLVFESPCTYCTCIQKVDTKDYGLPQTRQRTYMFVWKADEPEDYDDDLGVYWQALVKFLASPVKHSLDAFILDDDHDNIRVLREALRGPPGRYTKRANFQAPEFYTSGNANVKHNTIARDKLGMDKLTRATTSAGAYGKKQIPPHFWLEYADCHGESGMDRIDILHASAARDAEAHDSHHSSFFWNLSQNVSKEKHRSAVPGIAGCISPGGQFFITNLGRPLLGCEKLLLQGIPYFRLLLGNETEVQLGDMAGNAMSLTVVCATLLANIACRQLRKEHPGKNLKQLEILLKEKAGMDHPSKGVLIPPSVPEFENLSGDSSSSFSRLAGLAEQAVKSGYQMSSHAVEEVKLSPPEHCLGTFLSKLRDEAPSSFVFDKDGIQFLASVDGKNDTHRVKDLFKFPFNLQKIQRQRRKWVLYYNARDRNGVGEVVASFIVSVGEISTQAQKGEQALRLGLKGELVSYMPAKTVPLKAGLLEPCAVLTFLAGEQTGQWRVFSSPISVDLTIKGSDPEDSFRLELGLTNRACEELVDWARNGPQKKYFKEAKNRGENRRWIYPENWEECPGTLQISSNKCAEVNGLYKRAPCRQTINQSALWIRDDELNPPLYLVMKPNIGRTGPDCAVISASISPHDASDIVVTLPSFWQPCDALVEKRHEMKAEKSNWITTNTRIGCSIPQSNIRIKSGGLPALVSLHGLSETQISMLYPFLSDSNTLKLKVHGGVESQKIIRAFNYLCVPHIMRHFAKTPSLSDAISPTSEWNPLNQKAGEPAFGSCTRTIPSPPNEQWMYDDERTTWMRVGDPMQSRKYYENLQSARNSFVFELDKNKSCLSIRCFPDVAAHHAAHFLLEGRGLVDCAFNPTVVSYRLSDASLQYDPSYARFKVFPCSSEEPQDVILKSPYHLYERQQKVVKKMHKIESGEIDFEEIEMAEHEMPGSTGLSVIAKASRTRKVSGGVIADAIGAGKTVISIALILKGLAEARRSQCLPRKSGASLVVVPAGLIDQWKSEIEKFTEDLKVMCIYSTSHLKLTTVKQIVEADVVIAPVDIIESESYTEQLSTLSGLTREGYDIPDLSDATGQREKSGAAGVWIPASSRDPYGNGANTETRNQRNRELSAFFTHCYLKSVNLLREKTMKPSDKGVPLEYFEWERVIVDEVHECLMSQKDFLDGDWFKEKNRRFSRELLGISIKDVTKRPLVFRKSIYGLTGTPSLDNSERVIELANLIGCTYIIGLSSHWRKLERESRRDIFLHQFLEPKQSREIRKAIYSKSQEYLKLACCRNTTEKEMENIAKVEETVSFRMTEDEKVAYLDSQFGIDKKVRSLAILPENFDPSSGHDVSKFLKQNARSPSRGKALVDTVRAILDKDPKTKIVVFADGRIGAGLEAQKFLDESGLGCTCLIGADVQLQNELIAYYQRADVTEADKKRPRVLLLHFENAAGLNLQTECFNLILYTPLYVGDGGVSGNAVDDASTEQQAIGRVYRPGQLRNAVNIFRLEMQGPNGEKCLDGHLIRRNTDKQTLSAATNAVEEDDQ